jgi:short-subunit dehydrogenase
VALVTRDAQRMEQTARQLRSLDGNSLVLLAEVADFQRLRAESARIEDQTGPLAIWVDNAVTSVFAPFAEATANPARKSS